jgi:hypothetical protein
MSTSASNYGGYPVQDAGARASNLNKLFVYHGGQLFHVQRRNGAKHGERAGWLNPSTGRWMLSVGGKSRLASRVIWEMHNGPIPRGMEIDHINRDKSDDQVENLRLATRFQNNANTRAKSSNTSGFKGVDPHRGKWRARIRINGQRVNLGVFETAEEAAATYNAKASEAFGEFVYAAEAGQW